MENDMSENEMVLFEDGEIRRVWVETEQKWYFSVVDVVGILSDSHNPRVYWSQLKRREKQSSGQLFTFCKQFKLKAPDGKYRSTDCADVEGILRIIQAIPSSKAEPFKLWLAQVGHERLQEIQNPELAAQRAREFYKAKGYSNEWIEARLQSIAVRNELTNEWKQRKVQEGKEYAILTAEISKATFGIKPGEHKQIKGLKNENLRDHMTNLELVFTMLGEASTTEIARKEDAQGFKENERAARSGGKIAGDARGALELQTGRPVVSSKNYLEQNQADEGLPSGDERPSAPR